MPYSQATIRLLDQIKSDVSIHEPSLWMWAYTGKSDLLGNAIYADIMIEAPPSAMDRIIERYERSIVSERYEDITDYKFGRVDKMETCEFTGKKIKPIEVDPLVIASLAEVWNTNFTQNTYRIHTHQQDYIQYGRMLGRLLRIDLHLEWAGFGTGKAFESKWAQLMNPPKIGEYPENGYGIIVREFVTPRFFDAIDEIYLDMQNYLPTAEKRRFYSDAWKFYMTNLDPAYYGDGKVSKVGLRRLLAKRVCKTESDLFDEEFKAQFREYDLD